MKTSKIIIALILSVYSQLICGQEINKFLDYYYFQKETGSIVTTEYLEIEGSPYLDADFKEGIIYLKDSSAAKLMLRYNIYSDEIEYRLNEINYSIGNKPLINKITIEGSVFVYLPFIGDGGYFELLELGNCILLQKRTIKYKAAEGPKPIEGTITPAKFIPGSDIFYIVTNDSLSTRIENMKSVTEALQDKKQEVEGFIDQQKLKKTKKDNLIQIAKFYNAL